MLILILINFQYSQHAVFSFEKGSNRLNHSSSGSLHPVKNAPLPPVKLLIPPPLGGREFTLLLFPKTHSIRVKRLTNPDKYILTPPAMCSQQLFSYSLDT